MIYCMIIIHVKSIFTAIMEIMSKNQSINQHLHHMPTAASSQTWIAGAVVGLIPRVAILGGLGW